MVIPARLESRRFPGKVLARETGKYLVQHVYESVLGVPGVTRVIVATDSEEVLDAAQSFGAEARMTSREHISGTDRVAEAVRDLEEEIVINVQGDEPTVRREDLSRLVDRRVRSTARRTGYTTSGSTAFGGISCRYSRRSAPAFWSAGSGSSSSAPWSMDTRSRC